MRHLLNTTLCCLLLLLGHLFAGRAMANEPFTGTVVAITDGDTLAVLVRGGLRKIRLAEIDAPEWKQAHGPQSKTALAALCYMSEAVVTPLRVDFYGRLVARVSCGGHDASLHQVNRGLAWAYVQYLTDPAIVAAQHAARLAGAGLWADADPVPPWLFRRAK